jgi:hypothetical protein
MGRTRNSGVRGWDQVTVRLPPGMRDKINEIAAQNGRSANAEIVARLERSLVLGLELDIHAVRAAVREELRAALTDLLSMK